MISVKKNNISLCCGFNFLPIIFQIWATDVLLGMCMFVNWFCIQICATCQWAKQWVYLYLFWCFHLRHSHHQRKPWPLLPVWSHVHMHRQALPEGCLHFAYMNSQKRAIFSEVVYIVTVFSHKERPKDLER